MATQRIANTHGHPHDLTYSIHTMINRTVSNWPCVFNKFNSKLTWRRWTD